MRLKQAEKARLLVLVEEAERLADAEAEKTAAMEAAVAERMGVLAATQQGMAEVRGVYHVGVRVVACGVWCCEWRSGEVVRAAPLRTGVDGTRAV